MPNVPRSLPWCWRCARDQDDGVQLFAVYLARPYLRADGRRTTRTIPIRVCRPCVEAALKASTRTRRPRQPGDLLEPSRPRAPQARAAHGYFASREATPDGSRIAAANR